MITIGLVRRQILEGDRGEKVDRNVIADHCTILDKKSDIVWLTKTKKQEGLLWYSTRWMHFDRLAWCRSAKKRLHNRRKVTLDGDRRHFRILQGKRKWRKSVCLGYHGPKIAGGDGWGVYRVCFKGGWGRQSLATMRLPTIKPARKATLKFISKKSLNWKEIGIRQSLIFSIINYFYIWVYRMCEWPRRVNSLRSKVLPI